MLKCLSFVFTEADFRKVPFTPRIQQGDEILTTSSPLLDLLTSRAFERVARL